MSFLKKYFKLSQSFSSETQKKKSRDAARQRRGQQNDEFSELASQLPAMPNASGSLDRLCVMRLSNSFVKMKHIIRQITGQCHHYVVALYIFINVI